MKIMPELKCVSGFLQKNACENIFVVFAFRLKTLQGIPTENIGSAICWKHVGVLFYK